MSQTNVEEVWAAVQRLPRKERARLSEFLQRGTTQEGQLDRTPETVFESSRDGSRDHIPSSREAEMQWLVDHPDFWEQHRGEFVALWGYEMIAVGRTGKEVAEEAKRRGIKFPLVQYLPKNENEWLLGMSNQPA